MKAYYIRKRRNIYMKKKWISLLSLCLLGICGCSGETARTAIGTITEIV